MARKGRGKSSRERKPPRTQRTERRSNRPQRKKVCLFCREKLDYVDFKDLSILRKYVNDRGRIRARRVTGTCARHQGLVAGAIKNAREVALLPYVVR